MPKGTQKEPTEAQSGEKEVERHGKETNKSQDYIHINKAYANSRSTAIQPPASISYKYFKIHEYECECPSTESSSGQ